MKQKEALMNIRAIELKALLIACVTLTPSHLFSAMQPSQQRTLMVNNNSDHDMSIKKTTSLMPEYFLSTETRKCIFPSGPTLEFFVRYDNSQSCHVSIPSESTRITLTKDIDTLIVADNEKEIILKEIKLQ